MTDVTPQTVNLPHAANQDEGFVLWCPIPLHCDGTGVRRCNNRPEWTVWSKAGDGPLIVRNVCGYCRDRCATLGRRAIHKVMIENARASQAT